MKEYPSSRAPKNYQKKNYDLTSDKKAYAEMIEASDDEEITESPKCPKCQNVYGATEFFCHKCGYGA